MPYEVELPNGTIVEGIPDDMPRDEVRKRIIAAYPDLAPKPEKESPLRQVADIPLKVTEGVVSGVRMLSDVFGADNPISKSLRGVEDYVGSLLSAQAKNDQKEIARIMKEAEDKGVLEQIKAGFSALTVAPVDLMAQVFGTAIPTLAGGLAGAGLRVGAKALTGVALNVGAKTTGALTGAAMGTGAGKSAIYDAVVEELSKANLPKEVIEQAATKAQEYGGKNLDLILANTLLGGVAGSTGLEKALIPAMSKRISEKVAQRGVLTRAAAAGFPEGGTEFLQGGTEQASKNIALQREGYDVPTMRGVYSAGTMEGLAGFGVGAAAGALKRPTATEPVEPPITEQPPVQLAPEPFTPTVIPPAYSTQEGIDRATGVVGGGGYTAADLLTPGAEGVREQAQRLAAQRDFDLQRQEQIAARQAANPSLNPEGFKIGAPRAPMTEEGRFAAQQAAQQRDFALQRQEQLAANQAANPNLNPEGFNQGRTPAPAPINVSPSQTPRYTPPVSVPDEERRRLVDAQSAELAKIQNEPFEFDRRRLAASASAVGGTGQVRGTPRAELVDTDAMPPAVARVRLRALQDDAAAKGENPSALVIVPHPTMGGRFAIERRFEPQKLYPYQKQVSQEEASKSLEQAFQSGQEQIAQKPERERQQRISQALSNIEARGGVASPAEAKLLQDENYQGFQYEYELPAKFADISKYDQSHGSAFDRGGADAFYGRESSPHKGGTVVNGRRLPRRKKLTAEEKEAYDAGYSRTQFLNNRKKERPLPYTRIDNGLAPQKTVDERLSEATGVELQSLRTPRESVRGEETARTAEYNAEQDRRRQLERAQKERETGNLVKATSEAPIPPQPQSVMDAFATPAPLRTAEQVSTINQARARLNPSDVSVLEMAGQDPASMKNAVERIQKEHDAKYSLTDVTPTPEAKAMADDVRKKLLPVLKRFGLEKMGLRLIDSISNGAEGMYFKSVITLALDNENPMGVMRHEVIHALKELGAFTNGEWKVLTDMAKKKWINQFYSPELQAAYKKQFDQDGDTTQTFDEYMAEEAIAQAFRFYTETKPPSGMIANLMRRLNNVFKAIREFFMGNGVTNAEQLFLAKSIFSNIESGRMTAGRAGVQPKTAPAYSLRDTSSLENSFEMARSKNYAKNRDFKIELQAAVLAAAEKEGLDLTSTTNEVTKHLIDVGTKDAEFAMKSNANAIGWYDKTVSKALAIVSLIHPEIRTNPDAKLAFTWGLAVTSNGIKVDKNFELAERVYAYYKKNKKMPTNIEAGEASDSINKGLKAFNDLSKKWTMSELRQFMATEMPAGLVSKITGMKIKGENATTNVLGAAILGPKIGNGFFSNLNGIFDQLTMDRWLMRTWGRWTGSLIENNPEQIAKSTETLKNLVNKILNDQVTLDNFEPIIKQKITAADLNDEEAIHTLAKKIVKGSVKPKNREEFNKTPIGEEIRKAANNLEGYIDGQKEAPDNGTERTYIREVFTGILDNMRKQGHKDMTMADLQALLWYPERRLYDAGKESDVETGYADDEAPDYANAATKIALKNKVPKALIETAAREAESGYERRTAAARRGNDGGTSDAVGRGVGFTGKAWKNFATRGVIQSYLERNPKTPQAFKRKSPKDGESLRVLRQDVIAEYSPEVSFNNALKSVGSESPKFYELTSAGAKTFQKSIQSAKDNNSFGAAVSVYPEEDYAKMRLFVSKDGKAGFALKGDDIVSVFSQTPHSGGVNGIMQLATQLGGRRLDAFDTVLPDLYFNNGFTVVARMKWHKQKPIPEGWSKQRFQEFNDGEPDIVFMAYDPKVKERPTNKQGIYIDYDDSFALQEKQSKGKKYGKYSLRPEQPAVRPSPQSDGTGRDGRASDKGGINSPLEGAPSFQGASGPDPKIVQVAKRYAELKGIPFGRQSAYVMADPVFGKRIADAYEKMADDPLNPDVIDAYQDLNKQIRDQYNALEEAGYEFTFFDSQTDPYEGNPVNAMRDLRKNKKMAVYGTYDGYGQTEISPSDVQRNPMLEDTGLRWADQKGVSRAVLANDLFRAVHDTFGHGIEGAGFRARGEENAFQAHAKLITGKALGALASETRGQNSWLNFGPFAEKNQTAKVEDTVFAEQKVGLMPSWTWTENIVPDARYSFSSSDKSALRPSLNSNAGISFNPVKEDAVSYAGSHYGKAKTNILSGGYYGTGLKGAEAKRLAQAKDYRIGRRVYFYIPRTNGVMPYRESGVGNHVYTQKFDNILGPGKTMSELSKKAQGDSNTFESLVIDSGYDGYAVPDYGMMVVLNNDIEAKYEGTVGEVHYGKTEPEKGARFSRALGALEPATFLVPDTKVNNTGNLGMMPETRDIKSKPIRLAVGLEDAATSKGYGANHILKRIEKDSTRKPPEVSKELLEDLIRNVEKTAQSFTRLYRDRNNLIAYNPITTESLILAERPDHYSVITSYRQNNMGKYGNIAWTGKAPQPATSESGKGYQAFVESQKGIPVKAGDSGVIRQPVATTFKQRKVMSPAAIQEMADDVARVKLQGKASLRTPPALLKQTLTDSFKRWFGKSAIVDMNGDPKVMYHGTARDITEFRGKQAGAIFVTDKPDFAEDFTGLSENFMVKESFNGMSKNEKVALLTKALKLAKKDKKLSKQETDYVQGYIKVGADSTFRMIPSAIEEEVIQLLKDALPSRGNIMPVFVRAESPFDFQNPDHIDRIVAESKRINGNDQYRGGSYVAQITNAIKSGAWEEIESKPVQDAIKAAGFDGFYIKENGIKNLAVYNPNQLKSAIGNTGAFSRESKDIRYSLTNNAPPAVHTKLVPNQSAGQQVTAAATNAIKAVREDGYFTKLRNGIVDDTSSLGNTLANQGMSQFANNKLRADMLKHTQSNSINIMTVGLQSGVPVLNTDGSIIIKRTESNIARSLILADKLDSNPYVKASKLKGGRGFVAEVARALRGADIKEEDAAMNAEGQKKINDADAMEASLNAAVKAGGLTASAIASEKGKIDKLRKEGKELAGKNREKQVDDAQIQWAEAQLKNVPELKEIFGIWKDVNDALTDLSEDTGIISKEQAQKYRDKKFYVPLFKAREDLAESFFHGSSAKNVAKNYKLEGADIDRNIWENIQKQYAMTIAVAYENQTRKTAIEQLKGFGLAKTVDNPNDPNINLRYKEDGKIVHAIAENPNDIAAFQMMNYELNSVMKFISGTTKVLRFGALVNPMFWFKQLIRDPIHASLTNNQIVTPFHSAVAFAKIINNSSASAKILAERGVIGAVDSTVDLNEYLGQLGKEKKTPQMLSSLMHNVMRMHESSDAATRVAIFESAKKEALKKGMNEEEAINFAVFRARESINFGVRGNSQTLNVLRHSIPFFQAAITSLDTVYRAATGYGLPPAERNKARITFAKRAAVMGLMSTMYAMMYTDDDEYKDLPDYVKDGNWLFPTTTPDGRKTFVKIPVPFEIGFLFKTLPEAGWRWYSGTSTGKEVAKSVKDGLIHNIPGGGTIVPQAFKPALEVIMNHSLFTGNPIEGMSDQGLPVAERGRNASEFAKATSKAGLDSMGLSPAKIDALIKGYFAELGGTFLAVTSDLIGTDKPTKNIESYPFAKSFTTDPKVSKAVADFYTLEHNAKEMTNMFAKLKKEGLFDTAREYLADDDKKKQMLAAPVFRKIGEQLGQIKTEIKRVENREGMDADEKRTRINELQKLLAQTAKKGYEVAERAGIAR